MPRNAVRGFSAAQLERYRKRNDFTQEELADAAGVSRQAISAWEEQTHVPTVKALAAVAEVLGVPIASLAPIDYDDLRLPDLRCRAGLNQADVAKFLQVSATTVAEIERGRRRAPNPVVLDGLAELYAVAVDEVREAWERTVQARDTQIQAKRSRAPG